MCAVIDLHSELSRQNRKQDPSGNESVVDKQVAVEGALQNGANLTSASSTSQHSTVPNTPSALIKANPSPQGTPLHTTFSGTQNFTPSTRISALNMVGELLRKVGVSLALIILASI